MLLSKSEQYQIRHALKLGLEYDTSVNLPYGTLTITVRPAPPVWGCTGIAQVRWAKGAKLDQQWVSTVQEVIDRVRCGPYWAWGKER